MNANELFMHARALLLALGCLLVGNAVADENLPAFAVFTFSAGYKIDVPEPENVVELGVIKKCGKDEWCMDINRYASSKMLPRIPTKYMHEMHAPYRDPMCFDAPVATVKGVSETGIKVVLQKSRNGFSVAWSDFRYDWIVDPKARDAYTLAGVSYNKGGPLEQAVGFGFSSNDELKGTLSATELAYYYKGEIYHKTAFTQVRDSWSHAPSTFDFRPYQKTQNGNVLIRSLPGDVSIVKKYGKQMWVQSSIVLSRGPQIISPLIQEYGHDFNMDGCFNESGHNKLMLPIGNKSVGALVYIEYTSDYERGFPMLSVGRYYR